MPLPLTPQTDSSLAPRKPPLSYQQRFHQRWPMLRDRHVRALAWLLEAPDLLAGTRWNGRIATLGELTEMDVTWLQALDMTPRALYLLLDAQSSNRLGRYAEKLLTFFLQQNGRLIAHNVQVRNGPNETIGEFDFLLRDEQHGGALHWEFATKFYLLESCHAQVQADAFVGPNLLDSLGAKMDKIMQQQLRLSLHPAAAQYLSQPVTRAQALVKGWLFYRDQEAALSLPPELGVATEHCHGFWCELEALDLTQAEHYLILPRLEWLAPARARVDQALSGAQLSAAIALSFEENQAPVMIAVCDRDADVVLERQRGFIVPDDWREKAAHRVQQALVRY